jgi:formylglycine-generating enzyme required for sulfatase activity
MIKITFSAFTLLTILLFSSPAIAQGAPASQQMVYETGTEFFGSADFNKDGRLDLVIVDKESGKYRLGYLGANGVFDWVDCRPSGIKGITGFNIGQVLTRDVPGLVFTSPDANQISMVEAMSPSYPPKPVLVDFTEALGPNSVLSMDPDNLLVGSIYNSPDENLVTHLRNEGGAWTKVSETVAPGPAVRANRLALRDGGQEFACGLIRGDQGSIFVAERGETRALELADLPRNVEYAAGKLLGKESLDFAFYQPGESKVAIRAISPAAGGVFNFGKETVVDLGQPVKYLAIVSGNIFAAFGEGESAGVFAISPSKVAESLGTVVSTNYLISGAIEIPDGFMVFSRSASGKFSTRCQMYRLADRTVQPGPFSALATLADNDNVTIPEIHARIVKKHPDIAEKEMQTYTNTIPGTRVSFVMVPIPSGEFLMGSPEKEADRKDDEGPQVKVKISPFWMGQHEITWNEYELFMYPDEERRARSGMPTDEEGDKLADAVTHPSRPYVEMSFGMGKDGFPAISMTQHAANKYCQWLSAKTGQFYRLPTEAEWEYACRAGTTTRYFFGDDDSKLDDYGWYEMNSDFKYQKVGKKKPNPWGLYDMTGNVVEWVLDQYDPEWYKAQTGVIIDPWNKATKPYPHSVRGGSWDDEASSLRSAARRGSDRAWKMQDPQLPKSVWYFSDAQFVGFRVVRPLVTPPAEEMQKYWSSGVERD